MKKALPAAVLCILLLLTGCASMLERGYSSHTSHTDTSEAEDASALRAENYQELLECVMKLVRAHEPYGTIRLYNYTGVVDEDLAAACTAVRFRDPLGAYAVRAISCESTRILTYYEVDARIVYAHTAEAIAAMIPTDGLSALQEQLRDMVEYQRSQRVLYLTGCDGSHQQLTTLLRLAVYADPASAAAHPAVSVSLYPESGSERVAELQLLWEKTAAERLEYAAQLAEVCDALLDRPEDGETVWDVSTLGALLSGALRYDPGGSEDPLEALEGTAANDLGVLLAMEALCRRAGISAQPATDHSASQLWLIVSTPSGFRHLLPRDLRPDPDRAEGWQLPLYTDEELTALGFAWDGALYPPCVDYSGASPAGSGRTE